MPPTSTPPLAQAPPEQNQAAAASTPQPAASLPSLTEPRTIISMESYQKCKRDEDLNSTTAKRVAPTIALVAAPSTLAHAPTDTRTMADTHQDTDMQATEPQGSSQNQQPAGASPSPKRPGLEEIRDECHPPVPYPNDSLFWEAEDELFPVLTDEEINNIETAFAQSTNMLVFHLNPDDAARCNIVNFREKITNDCKYFFNITFPTPLSGGTTTASTLMGTPIERHIEAWSAAKRGYMLLPKVMILKRLKTHETLAQHWMHQPSVRQTLQIPSDVPNQALTELIYANYHALRRTQSTHPDIPNSLQLRPLSELHWDQPTQTFFNPILPANSHLRDTKLRLSPIPPSIRPADIALVLAEHVFYNTDVDITGTVATLTFYNSEIRDIAWQTWRTDPLVVRDYPLAVSALTGPLQ
ncbi:unnamed protein product [Aphanomyces euteiches]